MSTTAEPERLGAYRLLEKLGQGGMAAVYRGERTGDAGFRKKVAIKRMLPQYRRDPSLLERFAAEARTNARLDHPNLVQVIDFGIEPEPYLVLELIEGVTLGAMMQRLSERGERLDIATACFIGAEIATGLEHAHRKKDDDGNPLGIVHRDVSPQNVLVSSEGGVKVSDFGLVKAADNVLRTQTGVTIGKLSYMAPEQANGQDVDARADIFSLGVTIWETLTIRSLIPHDDPLIAANLLRSGDFPLPSSVNHDVPPELDRIVMGCLAIDPETRTPSAQQVAQALRELLHARAGGYGREQLARFVQWLFPEKGWELAEPEQPPAQPSPGERASMVPVTPAAVAVARAANVTGALPAQLDVGRTSTVPPPAKGRASLPWLALAALIGAATVVALGLVIGGVSLLYRNSGDRAAASAMDETGPVLVPLGAGVIFESRTPGLRLFLGARELGGPPIHLSPDELTGEPLVALAPLCQPQVVRAERLVELTRTIGRVHQIELEPSRRPDVMVYVRYDGQGTAHLVTGEVLGQVPGVIVVPTRRDTPTPTEITVFDESGQTSVTLSLDGCEDDKVCVLYAGSGS